MERVYPKLNNLAWHSIIELSPAKAKTFVELNPSINVFSLFASSKNIIRNLTNEGIRIDELFYVDFHAFLDDLKILYRQQSRSRLHLTVYNNSLFRDNLDKLNSLSAHIEGLYFGPNLIDDNLAKAISIFENLKVLELNIGSNANLLSQSPNLRENFFCIDCSTFEKDRTAILTYSTQTPSWKKIYIHNSYFLFYEFNFQEIAYPRQKLAKANKIQIFFKNNESDPAGRSDEIECYYDTISVERIETEPVFSPLITRCFRHCMYQK